MPWPRVMPKGPGRGAGGQSCGYKVWTLRAMIGNVKGHDNTPKPRSGSSHAAQTPVRAWNVITSWFTFFSTHFFQAIDPGSWSSRAAISFQGINALSLPLWLSPGPLPWCLFHSVPTHASATVLIILKVERVCFCWSCPILFSLYWAPKCAVSVLADEWGRKASGSISLSMFRSFPARLALFSLLTAHLTVRLFLLPLEVTPFHFTCNICLRCFLSMCLRSKLFCSVLSYHVWALNL